MKKVILKVFGVAALAAGMLYNVQLSSIENVMDISLVALGNIAAAQSENDLPEIPHPGNPTAPGDSTKRGDGALIMDKWIPCARASTNYC